jgi:hypothetical protein
MNITYSKIFLMSVSADWPTIDSAINKLDNSHSKLYSRDGREGPYIERVSARGIDNANGDADSD